MVKIVALVIILAILCYYLKSINSEIFPISLIASGIIILSLAFNYLGQAIDIVNKISYLTQVNQEVFLIVIKITSVAFIVEFGAGIVEDLGLFSLSSKLVFVGKIIILNLSLPLIYSIINVLVGLLE